MAVVGDGISIGTGGALVSAAVTPSTPTLAVTNDGDGDAVTATIGGGPSGTVTLYYRRSDAIAWTEGDGRVGDGTIAQAGLDAEYVYEFIAVHAGDGFSLPSSPVFLLVSAETVAASGPISLAAENLRTLLANSTTFQALVDEGSAELAKNHIYIPFIDGDNYKGFRPYALIDVAEDDPLTSGVIAGGALQHFQNTGALELLFEINTPSEFAAADQERNAHFYMLNRIGAIIVDMQDLSGGDGFLVVSNIEFLQNPQRAEREIQEDEGDFYQTTLLVNWGP